MATPIGVPSGETPHPFTRSPIAKPVVNTKPTGRAATNPLKPGSKSVTAGLTGPQRDADVALTNLFDSYGLKTLAPTILGYIQKGYSSDTISILLQDTPEYKQRFAANATRLKAGLPVLSPAEYIATEQSYRQLMSAAGLPPGFYDQTSDFTKLIAADVSPTEVQDRVNAAQEAIQKAPPETLSYFKQFYSSGDLVAYALDPTKAAPLVEQRLKSAEAAAIGSNDGVQLSRSNAEKIGTTGQSLADIQSGLQFVGQEQKTTDKLSQLYGGAVTQDDLVAEVFDNDANAASKRTQLASRERGSFAQSTGQGKTSLAKDSGGF